MITSTQVKKIKVSKNGKIKLLLAVELSHFSELDLSNLLSKSDIEKLVPVAAEQPKVEPVVEQPAVKAKPVKNDLKKLKGIGPKLEQFLHEKGIKTFKDVYETSFEDFRNMLDAADLHIIDPSTWAEQAAELMK